jgi:hypothetical protein
MTETKGHICPECHQYVEEGEAGLHLPDCQLRTAHIAYEEDAGWYYCECPYPSGHETPK